MFEKFKQEDVKEKVDEIFEQLKGLEANRKIIIGRLRALQDFCEHPKDKRVKGDHMGREYYTKCLVCKKEW